jgi:hypothetical protein
MRTLGNGDFYDIKYTFVEPHDSPPYFTRHTGYLSFDKYGNPVMNHNFMPHQDHIDHYWKRLFCRNDFEEPFDVENEL